LVKVQFWVSASSYMNHVRMHLYCGVNGRTLMELSRPDMAAYIVNKYVSKIRITEYGYGYEAELPENALLALEYSSLARETSFEELDAIVASGKTKLHMLREELGFPTEGMAVEDLFFGDLVGKGFYLKVREYPLLILYTDGGAVRVELDAETIEKPFLKRALDGGLEEAESRMLHGIMLLGRAAQRKYVALLSRGELSMDDVAKAVLKSAVQAKDRHAWLTAIEWLKENGYTRQANEIVIRKTICI